MYHELSKWLLFPYSSGNLISENLTEFQSLSCETHSMILKISRMAGARKKSTVLIFLSYLGVVGKYIYLYILLGEII